MKLVHEERKKKTDEVGRIRAIEVEMRDIEAEHTRLHQKTAADPAAAGVVPQVAPPDINVLLGDSANQVKALPGAGAVVQSIADGLKQLKQLAEAAAKAPAAAPMVDVQPAQQAQTGMAIVRVDEGLGEETRRTHTNLRSDEYRMRHCSCRQGHCKAQGSAR